MHLPTEGHRKANRSVAPYSSFPISPLNTTTCLEKQNKTKPTNKQKKLSLFLHVPFPMEKCSLFGASSLHLTRDLEERAIPGWHPSLHLHTTLAQEFSLAPFSQTHLGLAKSTSWNCRATFSCYFFSICKGMILQLGSKGGGSQHACWISCMIMEWWSLYHPLSPPNTCIIFKERHLMYVLVFCWCFFFSKLFLFCFFFCFFSHFQTYCLQSFSCTLNLVWMARSSIWHR